MAVVINEFEVVPAPSPSGNASSGGDNSGQSGSSQALTVHELEKLYRRQQERLARVRAY